MLEILVPNVSQEQLFADGTVARVLGPELDRQ